MITAQTIVTSEFAEFFTNIEYLLRMLGMCGTVIGLLSLAIFNMGSVFPDIAKFKEKNPRAAANYLKSSLILFIVGSFSSAALSSDGSIPFSFKEVLSEPLIGVGIFFALLLTYLTVNTASAFRDKIDELSKRRQERDQLNVFKDQLYTFVTTAKADNIAEIVGQLESLAEKEPQKTRKNLINNVIQHLKAIFSDKKSYEEEMSIYDNAPKPLIESTKISLDKLLGDDGELNIKTTDEEELNNRQGITRLQEPLPDWWFEPSKPEDFAPPETTPGSWWYQDPSKPDEHQNPSQG